MYDKYNIVWGIPYTREIEQAAFEAGVGLQPGDAPYDGVEDFDYAHLEELGFEFAYTGNIVAITPGWFGEVLGSGDSRNAMKLSLKPTSAQEEEVAEGFAKLPDWLKAVAPKIGIYMIWSTS